jgi:hypothetical protein
MIRSVVNVNAPRSQVFHALTDFARYTQWVPGCEACGVVKADGNIADVDLTIDSMRRMEIRLRFESEPCQSIRFRLLRSSDIKGYSGTYRLMDSADQKGTVVIAELEIDGGFLAPQFVVDRVATKAVQETGEALKSYVRTLERETEMPSAPARMVPKKKRDKRIVRVIGTPTGYQVMLFGETLFVERNR